MYIQGSPGKNQKLKTGKTENREFFDFQGTFCVFQLTMKTKCLAFPTKQPSRKGSGATGSSYFPGGVGLSWAFWSGRSSCQGSDLLHSRWPGDARGDCSRTESR